MEHGTILLVDDNPQILTILAELLRPLGQTIFCADSGPDALARAVAAPPDLILLDVMMPGMDGFTVCRHIRAHPLLAQIPVIMVTALDDRDSRLGGFEAGADEFVSKPFDYVELRARVSTILRLNRYRKLLEQQQRVAAERARFVWAVERSDDGILVLGPADEVHYANPRARQLFDLAPEDELRAPFLSMAAACFTLIPPELWEGWPTVALDDELSRFLVAPETAVAAERWLRVDLLPPVSGDDARVVRLRDVTEQITSQREMWTFHAMLTHKLRTPMVGILGGLSILNSGVDQASVTQITEVALASARRLRAELEDILHYLRPPADLYGVDGPTVGEVALLAEQIGRDLGAATVCASIEPSIAEQRLRLTRHSIEVLLRELTENAVKFHPQRAPQLELALTRNPDGKLALALRDDGLGLEPTQLAQVWRPYYQAERSFTGQVDGMGLGLALVARIIHAVGGHYELRNRSDGQGAVVALTLPLAV